MSDNYFKEQAQDFIDAVGLIPEKDSERVVHELYTLLKEVARDQRYACVDAVSGRHIKISLNVTNAKIPYRKE